MKHLIILFLPLMLTGCAFAPSEGVRLDRGAEDIEVGNERPASYFVSKGAVYGKDGGGCGYYGYFGTRQNAINNLLNEASKAGADYVQITGEQDSYKSMSCETNLYKISAIAYWEDNARKNKILSQQSMTPQDRVKKDQEETKQLIAGFIETCKSIGFKPATDGMGMCLLTQQTRYDSQVGRELQQQTAQEAAESQSYAQSRSQIVAEEAAQASRAAQQEAAIQGAMHNMQNSINNALPIKAPPTNTDCKLYGNSMHCTEY
jgi:hypothetical protein